MSFLNPVMTMSTLAKNNRRIGAVVKQVGEEGTKNCFRVEVRVDSLIMAHSHHDDSTKAKESAEKMHAAYMEVHSKPIDTRKPTAPQRRTEMPQAKCKIVDWTGKDVYPGKEFDSTTDAWDFLTEDQRQRHPEATVDEVEQIMGEFATCPVA